MTIIMLIALLSLPPQVTNATRLPVTIEVKKDVEVTHNYLNYEPRGKLYFDGRDGKPFVLKKGQRFQMVEIGQEGGCRIKVGEMEYGITSCPWLKGFADHQTDLFRVVANGK